MLGTGSYALSFFQLALIVHYARSTALEIQRDGVGYSSPVWLKSETISKLNELQYVGIIYSNGPDVIKFLTDRTAIIIPYEVIGSSLKQNDKYNEQLIEMSRAVNEENAIIVYFDNLQWRWYLPTLNEIETVVGLPHLLNSEDGTIFGNPLIINY